MKNGLIKEQEHLVYYKNDKLYHAGVVKVDGDIYYIGSKGRAVKGVHVVHGEMANGILKRGTYTFGEDYKLIPNSYVAPRKRKQKPLKKLKKKLEKAKKWLPAAALSVVLVAVIAVISFMPSRSLPRNYRSTVARPNIAVGDTDHIPMDGKEILLVSSAAKLMYDGQMTVEDAVDKGIAYRPCTFEYELDGKAGTLRLWEQGNPAMNRVVELPAEQTNVNIDNLKPSAVYEYEVTCGEKTYTGSFTTAASNRFITLPGVINTRDIGGYTTLDGRTVKLDMIIRGTELDGLTIPSYFLTEEGIIKAQDEFDFAYEFDLRGGHIFTGEYRSRLGENVGHKFYGSPQYGEAFNRSYLPAMREIFTDLADPSKYPMYLHCTYGNDRTGTIVFLLQGLLNVSEEDMFREFRLSGFATPAYAKSELMTSLIASLEHYDGDTVQEKIYNYMTQTVGITPEQIETIRSIMLQ